MPFITSAGDDNEMSTVDKDVTFHSHAETL